MDIGIWHREWWFEPPILFRAHKTSERTNDDEDTSSVTMVIIRLQLCRTRTLDDHQLLQIGWCLESRSSMGLRRTADRWAAMYPQGALGRRGKWIPPCNISSLNFRVKPKSLPCSAEPKYNAPVLSCLWKSFIFRCFFYWTNYRFRNNAVSHCHVFFLSDEQLTDVNHIVSSIGSLDPANPARSQLKKQGFQNCRNSSPEPPFSICRGEKPSGEFLFPQLIVSATVPWLSSDSIDLLNPGFGDEGVSRA